jgi:hypothetical protein
MDPIDKTLQDAQRAMVEGTKVPSEVAHMRLTRWREYAPDCLLAMLDSEDEAKRALRHPTARVRLAAIEILLYHWRHWDQRPPGECARLYEELALRDPDLAVRCAATLALGRCYNGTADLRVGRAIANLVLDGSLPAALRRAALASLYSIRGLVLPDWPGRHTTPPSLLRVPVDVDWPFVNSFVTHRGGSGPTANS